MILLGSSVNAIDISCTIRYVSDPRIIRIPWTQAVYASTAFEASGSSRWKGALACSILIAHSLGGIHGGHRKREKSEEEPKELKHVNNRADAWHDNTAIG